MTAPTIASKPTVFGRDLARRKPTIVRAEGIRMWDSDGNEYIDGSSGAVAVISIGHGRQEVIDAMAEQAGRVAYVHGGLLQHEAGEALGQALTSLAPGNLKRVIFVSGGSEANESAIKLARQYQVIRGKPQKSIVLSRQRSYHGMTLGALSLSGYPVRRGPFAPLLLWEPAVVECNCYRCPLGLEYPSCEIACATDLERALEEVGAENVAAFIAEPIVAAAGPALTPPPGYFERIRAICDAHDILFIADEVVTGMGRTGLNFGIEHWNVVPDVLTTAKGVSGGYAPLAAVLLGEHIAAVFEEAGQPFIHGFTYMEHPVSCAAGLAVLRIIEREHLVDNAADQGEYLMAKLQELKANNPLIGDVRGKGLLTGVELVAERASKRPFDPALGVTAKLLEAARARGLMLYPGNSGDGVVSDQFLLSPPLIVTRDDIDEIMRRLTLALADIAPLVAEA